MFNNIPEMLNYIEKLKFIVDQKLDERKKNLGDKCECCKINPIEVTYKANNFTEEYLEDDQIIYKINANFFCKSCYKHVIESGQLEKSQFMTEIDNKYQIV